MQKVLIFSVVVEDKVPGDQDALLAIHRPAIEERIRQAMEGYGFNVVAPGGVEEGGALQ